MRLTSYSFDYCKSFFKIRSSTVNDAQRILMMTLLISEDELNIGVVFLLCEHLRNVMVVALAIGPGASPACTLRKLSHGNVLPE